MQSVIMLISSFYLLIFFFSLIFYCALSWILINQMEIMFVKNIVDMLILYNSAMNMELTLFQKKFDEKYLIKNI